MSTTVTIGADVRVQLLTQCDGGGLPHDPTEDGAEGRVTDNGGPPDHPLFVCFWAGVRRAVPPRHLIYGRHYAACELELIERPA